MICSRCRSHLLLRLSGVYRSTRPQVSFLHSSTTADTPSPRQPPPQPSADIGVSTPAAISSSTPGISQPLSTPGIPSSSRTKGQVAQPPQPARPPSSVPGGTELKGLAYLKNKPVILAKEDDEYPDWLWGLLDRDPANAKKNDGVDLKTMNKKQRMRHARKMAALEAAQPKRIPLHEQSVDLTPPDAPAAESLGKIKELTQSARKARRKGIRESNFLRQL